MRNVYVLRLKKGKIKRLGIEGCGEMEWSGEEEEVGIKKRWVIEVMFVNNGWERRGKGGKWKKENKLEKKRPLGRYTW